MKAMIAMSGGVDSSVAAYLTGQMGYECIGVTMKLLPAVVDAKTGQRTCCALEDVLDAKSVARKLGFPHYTLNFTSQFHQQVICRFADAYAAGLTPNPCIDCNRYLKFGLLLHRALQLGCNSIVTGHYAQIEQAANGRMLLRQAADRHKDQTYFLYTMTQPQLRQAHFPLGGLNKNEVRDIATQLNLHNAKKQDSQDICFVANGKYGDFVKQIHPEACAPGNFVNTTGDVLGTHKGIANYTIGQRRGIGFSYPEPLYVTGITAVNNTITLGSNTNLYASQLTATNINLIAEEKLSRPVRATAKIRSAQQAQPVWAEQTAHDELRVVFDEPQRAITPGQAVVLYQDGYVLGGGVIAAAT